jgi:transglutaminase-like putative cysteine protease
MLHVAACLIGYWFAVWLTCYVGFHVPWTHLLGTMKASFTSGFASAGLPDNTLVFFFYLSFLCFFLGYFGCWLVYHAHLPWLVALVYSAILLVNLNYVQQDAAYLVVLLAAALVLLIARVHIVTQLVQWVHDGLYTDQVWRRAMTWRCMRVACVLAFVVVIACMVLPVPAQPESGKQIWDRMNTVVNTIADGHLSLQDPRSLLGGSQTSANFFGDQLPIVGKVSLPSGEVLTYSSTSAAPSYLEGFTYNHFDGHTWTTTLTARNESSYLANTTIPADVARSHANTLKTTVNVVRAPEGSKNYIFAPDQPIRFTVPTTVYNDGTSGAWVQQVPLQSKERYQVTSLEPVHNTQSLQAVPLPEYDGTPSLWKADANFIQLAQFYLQTPKDLSPAVARTMHQWTNGAHDAYSALKLLETHLSDPRAFIYSLDNAPVPNNVDAVDWLLQTRTGYCTYYATAMAIMARQLGIPTRVVNGFSQGMFDQQRHAWSVQGGDAHSWVQAYLPSIGWVDFDPTPGYPANAMPVAQSSTSGSTHNVGQVLPGKTQLRKQSPTPTPTQKFNQGNQAAQHHSAGIATNWVLWTALGGLLVVIALLVLIGGLMYRGRNFSTQGSLVTQKFLQVCYLAGLTGLGPKSWQTPYEYGEMLSRHVPQQTRSLWRLTEMFVRERWAAPHQVPRYEEVEAVEKFWPSLQHALLWRRWHKR